jgi:flagellar hook-associated protein 1 FlgK
MVVGMVAGGNFMPFAQNAMTGGELGATLSFRQTLESVENSIGRVAITLAANFNAQHDVGQDLNGNLGTDFFAAGKPLAFANANNTGSAVLGATIANPGALTTSDYRLTYDGANYTLTRIADNTQQSFATLPQTVDGVTIAVTSGAAAAGDSFLIQPTKAGATAFSALISDPTRVAAALPVRATVPSSNTGSGTLRVDSVTPPAGANLTQAVSIVFTSATTFNVTGTGTGNPTGLTYTPGMTISYNGWGATLNGTQAAGDTLAVGANSNGKGDNGNAKALAGLQLGKLLAGGTTSLNEAYAQLVSDVGNQARAAQTGADAQKTVLTNAYAAQQAVSGVNLDEEAANLLKYQQAYQAAGKVIATASTLFDTILGLMR